MDFQVVNVPACLLVSPDPDLNKMHSHVLCLFICLASLTIAFSTASAIRTIFEYQCVMCVVSKEVGCISTL